ncbi:MAG TPA: hypothetical protein VEX38_00530, partial [Fimbriimonadaceae bacterium]|nr:hypothetical protein [Fimbriimonadaceae bacterium]
QNRWWGWAEALVAVSTTRTPSSAFKVSFLRKISVNAEVLVSWSGATCSSQVSLAAAQGASFNTRNLSANWSNPTDEDEQSASNKIFLSYSGATWTQNGSTYTINLTAPMSKNQFVLTNWSVPSGSSSSLSAANVVALSSAGLKPSTLTFGPASAGWLTGSYNAYDEDGVEFEVYSQYNLLLDRGASIDVGATTFSIGMAELNLGNQSTPTDYKLRFFKPGALRKAVNVTYDPSCGLTGVSVAFVWGDVDMNNVINQIDLDLILEYDGCTTSDTAYWGATAAGTPVCVCDITKDGVIDADDYDLARQNLDLEGD